MASQKTYSYEDDAGIFIYKIKTKRESFLDRHSAIITDFTFKSKDVYFPSTIKGITVKEILLGDSVWKDVESLFFPYLSMLGLSNHSFPSLKHVECVNDNFYTDGRMIYSYDKKKLYFSLAGREDEVIHVPDYVKFVDQTAFCNSRCKEIVFENPKVKIDVNTFRDSTYIKYHPLVTLGDKLIYLGKDLPLLDLPEEVTKIEKEAFSQYTPHNLRSSYLPDLSEVELTREISGFELKSKTAPISVRILKESYPSLVSIKVPEDHEHYEVKKGVLYDKLQKKLLYYPPLRPEKTYEIEEGTLSIGPYAFSYASYLEEVIIPDSVTEIAAYAFICCKELKKINLPAGIEGLASSAGYDLSNGIINTCPKLKELGIPQGVKYLGYGTIYSTSTHIKNLTFPDTLEYLGGFCLPPLKNAEVHLPASLLVAFVGSLQKCSKIWAYEGTAKKLVLAINSFISAEKQWRQTSVIVLDKNGQEKALFFIPAIKLEKGRIAMGMAWDSEQIDYDSYMIAFRHMTEDLHEDKLIMALLLVIDGALKGEAWDYLQKGTNLSDAILLLIKMHANLYMDRLLAFPGLTIPVLTDLLKKTHGGEMAFFQEKVKKKIIELEGRM